MHAKKLIRRLLAAAAGTAVVATLGCCTNWTDYYQRPVARPLGSISDSVWRKQEANAERSDFVVHLHEFQSESPILNTDGEDHVKQIAHRLSNGHEAQVIVERSRNAARPDTLYRYRVHPDPDLDMRRRDVVVKSLVAMGIADADSRVVVAPALAPNYRAGERAATYDYDQTEAGGGNFGGFFFGPTGF